MIYFLTTNAVCTTLSSSYDNKLFVDFSFLVQFNLYLNANLVFFFFFFQAEDGIRDIGVTGVQTCALPISASCRNSSSACGTPWRWATPPASAAVRHETGPLTPIATSPRPDSAGRRQRRGQIGRGACRGRGEMSVGGVSFKKKKRNTQHIYL